jgi:hypothetical protein
MDVTKKRTLSEDTAELSETEADGIVVRLPADSRVSSVPERFTNAVKRLLKHLARISGPYWLEPITIAHGVAESTLEAVSVHLEGVFVRAVIRNHSLQITSISAGTAHASGIRSVLLAVERWNSSNFFDTFSHATTMLSEVECAAPDVVITVPQQFSQPGSHRHSLGMMEMILCTWRLLFYLMYSCPSSDCIFTCTVVAELEMSNRSVAQMRQDFLPYFADSAMQCVIAIKIWGPGMILPLPLFCSSSLH